MKTLGQGKFERQRVIKLTYKNRYVVEQEALSFFGMGALSLYSFCTYDNFYLVFYNLVPLNIFKWL